MALNVAVRNDQLARLAQTIGARHGLSCALFNASEGAYDPDLGAAVGTFSTSCPGRDLSPTTQRFEAARMEFERARLQVEAGLAGDPRAALTPRPQVPTFVPTPSAAYPAYAPPVIPGGPPVPQMPAYAPAEMRPAELPRPEPRPWEPVPIARPEARVPAPRPAVPAIDRGWTMHEMWIDISDTAWYPGRGADFIPMSDVLVYGAGSGQETPPRPDRPRRPGEPPTREEAEAIRRDREREEMEADVLRRQIKGDYRKMGEAETIQEREEAKDRVQKVVGKASSRRVAKRALDKARDELPHDPEREKQDGHVREWLDKINDLREKFNEKVQPDLTVFTELVRAFPEAREALGAQAAPVFGKRASALMEKIRDLKKEDKAGFKENRGVLDEMEEHLKKGMEAADRAEKTRDSKENDRETDKAQHEFQEAVRKAQSGVFK